MIHYFLEYVHNLNGDLFMSQKKCPSCNAQVAPQSKFCPECGSAMSKKAAEKTSKSKNNSTRDTIIIVAVLAVVATGYFVINRPEPTPTQPPQQALDGSHQDVDGMASALQNMPTDYNSLVQLGNQTMDQGNFPMAAECYKRALILQEDSPNVRTDYGACLHGMGLPQRAIDEFMNVTFKYPKHTIANFNLGIVYYSISQPDSAKHYFNKFLSFETEGQTADAARKYLTELNK